MNMGQGKGTFLCLEGLDKSGKDTQQEMLRDWLEAQGYDVVFTREPGGTPIGEKIRKVLLAGNNPMSPKTEALLFMASRAEFVPEVVVPAIERGQIVLTSRYFFSTFGYQGFGRGLSIEDMIWLAMFATGKLIPDLTILLDIDVDTMLSRLNRKAADRIEREGSDFFERIRSGYLWLSEDSKWGMKVVDGSQPISEVHTRIRTLVEKVL